MHCHRSFGAAILFGLCTAMPASAMTFILDFDTASKTDRFGYETGVFDPGIFGFSAALSRGAVISGILDRVRDHFLGYVTSEQDVLSPLAPGFELDIDFRIGSVTAPPADLTDYAYLGIGPNAAPDPTLYGVACVGCVRMEGGRAYAFGPPGTEPVGSVFTDAISNSSHYASDDEGLFNLIAGTTSHEIAHTLSLLHEGAQDANPGASAWGVMGSGSSAMPNGQRVLEREFTYANFDQLIGAVGLRPVTTAAVPLPAALPLLLAALGSLMLWRRRGPAPVALPA